MKNLSLIIGLAAGLAASVSKAQSYSPAVDKSLFTCAASAATNIAAVLDVRGQKDVNVQFEIMNDAAGAVTYTFPYQRSVDGTSYQTALDFLTVSANGVTKQVFNTNLNTYGAGYIKFPYATNAHATINGTNIVIQHGQKKLAT